MAEDYRALQDAKNAVAHLAVLKQELATVATALSDASTKRQQLARQNELLKAESVELSSQVSASIKTLESTEAKVKEIISSTLLTIDGLYAKIAELKALTDEVIAKGEVELTTVEGSMRTANEELDSVRKTIESEKAKVEMPMKALEAQQASLISLKRDLDIYQSRVQVRYKELFPDRVMKL